MMPDNRLPGIYNLSDRPQPRIDSTAFIADSATLIGEVIIGAESSVWFGAVVRADDERIQVGDQTNVQDLCCLHADTGLPCILGNRVTLGHGAIVHGAIVEDEVLIGMRAVILNGVRIGTGSIVAAGTVVPEHTQIPAGSLVMGIPGQVRRQTHERDQGRIDYAWRHYVESGRRYRSE